MNSYTRKAISTFAILLTAGNTFAATPQSINPKTNSDNVESLRRDLGGYSKILLWCRNGHVEYQPKTGEMKIVGNGISVRRIRIGEETRQDLSFLDVLYRSRYDLFQGKARPSPQMGDELQINADQYTIKGRLDNIDLFTIVKETVDSPIVITNNPNSEVYRPKPKINTPRLTQQNTTPQVVKLEKHVYSRDTTNISVKTNKTSKTKLKPRKETQIEIALPNFRRELYYTPNLEYKHISIHQPLICFDYQLADSPVGSMNLDSLESAISQERINDIAREMIFRTPRENFAIRTISYNHTFNYDITKVRMPELINPVFMQDTLEQSIETLDVLVSQELIKPHPQFIVPKQIERRNDPFYVSEKVDEIDMPATITENKEIPIIPERLAVMSKKPRGNHSHSTARNVILGFIGASAGYLIVDAITPEKSSSQKPNEAPPGIH
jgi:hypothetical protein